MNNRLLKIICLGILAHFPSNKIFFEKLNEMSKKGTIIILQSSLLNFPTNRINKIIFSNRYNKRFNYKINHITEEKLKYFFERYGFEVIAEKKYSVSIPLLDKIVPSLNYYIDSIFDKLFPSIGSEGIFLLKKK